MTRASRRTFLQAAAGSTAALSLSGTLPRFLWAAGPVPEGQEKILVVVQLNGGNDGLNTVVPYRDKEYRRARPTLALPADQVLPLEKGLGLHPALKGFAKLWEAGRLGIVQGVGYPNPDRSHFESMDIWNTARRTPDAKQTGWLGRWLDRVVPAGSQETAAFHLGDRLAPLALVGDRVHAAGARSLEDLRLKKLPSPLLETALDASLSAPREGQDLAEFLRESTRVAVRTGRRLEAARAAYRPAADYPGHALGERLRTVAELIDANLPTRIYYVTLDGFDTHSDQAAAHAALLGQLGDALAAFLEDLAAHGHAERVLTLTFSEFGRRVAENGSRGTDHGAAAPLFLAGGKLKPGLHGDFPSLTDLDDGDQKFRIDFRQVYATLLQDWLSANPSAVLGETYAPLPLLRG